MDLWIRSQDKHILQKVKKLYVSTYSEEVGFGIYDINYDDIDDCDVPLGFYKTRERALEVLDEIQNILKPRMIIKNEGRDCVALDGTIYRTNLVSNVNSDIQQLSSYVYQMPKE